MLRIQVTFNSFLEFFFCDLVRGVHSSIEDKPATNKDFKDYEKIKIPKLKQKALINPLHRPSTR